MKLQLPKYVPNLLIFLFTSLYGDIESFFSSVRFFSRFFSVKWNHFLRVSNKPLLYQNPCNGDQECIGIGEINMMMMVCRFEEINEGEVGQDLESLFDEEEPSLDEIKETFKVFDVNSDGVIDAGELHRVVCGLGLKDKYELEECKKMIKAFDGSGDGLIDFHGFVKIMEKCLC